MSSSYFFERHHWPVRWSFDQSPICPCSFHLLLLLPLLLTIDTQIRSKSGFRLLGSCWTIPILTAGPPAPASRDGLRFPSIHSLQSRLSQIPQYPRSVLQTILVSLVSTVFSPDRASLPNIHSMLSRPCQFAQYSQCVVQTVLVCQISTVCSLI